MVFDLLLGKPSSGLLVYRCVSLLIFCKLKPSSVCHLPYVNVCSHINNTLILKLFFFSFSFSIYFMSLAKRIKSACSLLVWSISMFGKSRSRLSMLENVQLITNRCLGELYVIWRFYSLLYAMILCDGQIVQNTTKWYQWFGYQSRLFSTPKIILIKIACSMLFGWNFFPFDNICKTRIIIWVFQINERTAVYFYIVDRSIGSANNVDQKILNLTNWSECVRLNWCGWANEQISKKSLTGPFFV